MAHVETVCWWKPSDTPQMQTRRTILDEDSGVASSPNPPIPCPQRLCANSPKDNKWFSVTTAGAGGQVHGIQKCYAGGSIKLLTWTGSWHLWRATWQWPRRKIDSVHGFSVPKLLVWGRGTGTQWRFQTDRCWTGTGTLEMGIGGGLVPGGTQPLGFWWV